VADEAGSIQLNTLLADLNHLQSTHDMVLIEGAGGLLCPIKGQLFMVDLARHCKAPVLLVTRPHLGTLNHTLLSVELARYRGVLPLGLVINEGARPLPAEEQASLAVQTAPQQLAHYSQVPLLGYLTHQSPLPQGLAAWQQAAQAWVATWPQPLPWHFPSP
jgi:dethiobiotin synthetase